MFKRTRTGILVVGLVLLMATGVLAYQIGGISVNQPCCSVEVKSILQGLKNVTKVPVGYEAIIFLQNITVLCTNPAGNGDTSQGVPFEQTVSLSSVQTDQAFKILKTDRRLSDITFHDADIMQALINAQVLSPATNGTGTCKKNFQLTRVTVNTMQVFGTLFADTTGACDPSNPRTAPACTIEDAIGLQCSPPPNQDLSSPFTYKCDTICQGDACSQPPEEL